MGFWWFLFVCNLFIPVTMIISGYWMWKHCPRNINSFMGYRTKQSMKNMDTWKFAHNYAGKLWWKAGWILSIPTVLVQLPFTNSNADKVGIISIAIIVTQIFVMIMTIIPVEKALRKNFNDDGTIR